MAKKELKVSSLREIGLDLDAGWDNVKNDIDAPGRTMYAIIALKRQLSEKGRDVQQTMADHGMAIGGEWTPEGTLKIPNDKIGEMNAWLFEFNRESIEIDYTPIKLGENDKLPPVLMDLLFDFIELVD